MSPPVLIVELGDSHNEVLLTQVSALRRADRDACLVLNARLRGQLHPELLRLAGGPAQVHFVGCATPFQRAAAAAAIRHRIRADGVRYVVLNTASGNAIQLLSLVLPRSVEAIGILHDVSRLETSSRQKVIGRRIRDYLVLADHLVPESPPPGVRFGSFYPIRYPDASPTLRDTELHLVVPGTVSRRRRDYERLISLWQGLDDATRRRVTIEILGDITRHDGPALEQSLTEAGIADSFVFHRGFVPEETFYSTVAGCHGLLPLLPLEGSGARAYRKYRISGTTSLAYAYRKPLVLHRAWRDVDDFALTGVFYDDGGLPAVDEFRTASHKVAQVYATESRFDPEVQEQRWLDFVLGAES